MSAINDFAALVETFDPRQSPAKPLKGETRPTTLVASIKCLAASFDGLVVDLGPIHTPRFAAQVVKKTATEQKIVWSLPCRSQSQAKTDAEAAARSFAANEAYTS